MKKLFSKLIPIAAAVGLTFAATSAQAAITLTNGGSTTYATDVKSLDWNVGAGVASGVGPFGTALTPDQKFTFRYQANLATVNTNPGGALTSAFSSGLDTSANGTSSGFEFTIVAKINEYVQSTSGNQAFFGVDGSNPSANKVAIYYDAAANANIATGTGFDDGQLVALLTVVPELSDSSFRATSSTTGRGQTYLVAKVVEAGDMINDNFLKGLSEIVVGIDFDSTLSYPLDDPKSSAFHAGGSSTFADYNVNTANDILFKVDGSSTLFKEKAEVPEPGTMMLMGMGMLGLLGAARRRKASK